jgi:hypothetical protein
MSIYDDRKTNYPINKPTIQWSIHPVTVWGGGFSEYYFTDSLTPPPEITEYNADPDLWIAQHLGFSTTEQYFEWLETEGAPLCSERTKSGHLCRNQTGHVKCYPSEWRAKHRNFPCRIHRQKLKKGDTKVWVRSRVVV